MNFGYRTKIVIGIFGLALMAAGVLFRERISGILSFGPREPETPSFSAGVQMGPVVPEQPTGPTPSVKPPYQGRDPAEFRPVPSEVKSMSQDALDKIRTTLATDGRSVRENPDFFNGWINIGILKKIIGDYEGARDAWEYASIIRPANAVSFANLGELYWNYLHTYPLAEKNFKIAIKNYPADVNTYISLSNLYFYSYKEKSGSAAGALLDGLAANPGDDTLLRKLADLYEMQGDVARALETWQKVQDRTPQDQEVARHIAELKKKVR